MVSLISHFPLPAMPFDTHTNIVFESGKSELVKETAAAVDKKADKYRYESVYAYHPYNKQQLRQGETVDFVVA